MASSGSGSGDAAVSAAGGIISTIIGGLFGNSQAKKERQFNAQQAQLNRDFQREERELSQDWTLDMWNRSNEYNSIGSQIDRARDAGVNPASIVGGDYKSAQAQNLSTSPQSGSAASTSSGGSIGSAIINSSSGLLSGITNGVKALADARAANEMIAYNQAYITSQIDHNYAAIEKFAHENDLTDANAELIRKSVSWMDGLNEAEIKLKSAQATVLYNKNYEIYQNILESKSRVSKNEADAAYTRSLTDYQEKVNERADVMLDYKLSQEEAAAAEAQCRREFAEFYNIPLGSQVFEFAWALQLKGKYQEYCDKCIAPKTEAELKPADYIVPAVQGMNGMRQFYDDTIGGFDYFDSTPNPSDDRKSSKNKSKSKGKSSKKTPKKTKVKVNGKAVRSVARKLASNALNFAPLAIPAMGAVGYADLYRNAVQNPTLDNLARLNGSPAGSFGASLGNYGIGFK